MTIRSLVTEWVAFHITKADELKAVTQYWAGVEKAATLAPGQFIAYNKLSRGELAGRVF